MSIKKSKKEMIYLSVIAVLFFVSIELVDSLALENNTNLPGMDYSNFNMTSANPSLCEQACNSDPNCQAFTYVKPDVQGAAARCWLKNGIPAANPDTCCDSGVKGTYSGGVKPVAALEQPNTYLLGELKEIKGIVATDIGEKSTVFNGDIIFRVVPGNKEGLTLILESLNLVSEGVTTGQGDSGVIGINIPDREGKVSYDSKTGAFSSEFKATLHYDLIDKIKGLVQSKSKGEQDLFYSYTESMDGALTGDLPQNIQASENRMVPLRGQLALTTTNPVVGAIRGITLVGLWDFIFSQRPAQVLTIQPVFIGTGPSDSTATGTAFGELINNAKDIWNRCGSVHCLKLSVLDPIYINNDAYRVLDDMAEASALRNQVNNADAVEVFVVERFSSDLVNITGGGFCASSGTASAKIVTCDQQLDVPCPPPCSSPCPLGGTCNCGPVNLYHLGHELGHALSLLHPWDSWPPLTPGTSGCIMEPSGFCVDNPAVMSAHDCRNATSPLLRWTSASVYCSGVPDVTG